MNVKYVCSEPISIKFLENLENNDEDRFYNMDDDDDDD